MLKRYFLCCVLILLPTFAKAELTGLSSILDIPQGTLFKLTRALEVKANRNYQVIGKDHLLEGFNTIHQTGNASAGKHHRYPNYDLYLSQWRQNVDQTYQDCLNRHRVIYHSETNRAGNSTIINRGNGNTNIIINQPSEKISGSYQGAHNCIQPQHTLTLLLIDAEKAEGGGIFKEGYQFKVDKVRYRQHGAFHSVTLYFDHPVAEGLRIISTQHPQEIFLYQLQHQSASNGFWQSIGSALNTVQHIGGQMFEITPPTTRYYD